jgi:hypothetical protein
MRDNENNLIVRKRTVSVMTKPFHNNSNKNCFRLVDIQMASNRGYYRREKEKKIVLGSLFLFSFLRSFFLSCRFFFLARIYFSGSYKSCFFLSPIERSSTCINIVVARVDNHLFLLSVYAINIADCFLL